jgi:hypothetical protein
MFRPSAIFASGAIAVVCASVGFGQDFPPTGQVVRWQVLRAFDLITVYDANDPSTALADVGTFQHQEFDSVFCRLNVTDFDWTIALIELNMEEVAEGDDPPEPPDYDEVFVRAQAFGAIGPPAGTPIPGGIITAQILVEEINTVITISRGFEFGVFEPEEDTGFKPTKNYQFQDAPPPVAILDYAFFLPEILGRNQDRLDGTVNFDTLYNLVFTFANSQAPAGTEDDLDFFGGFGFGEFFGDFRFSGCEECTFSFTTIQVVSNPALDPANASPIADASVSAQTVAAGALVTLDGSRTFDSTNEGFDPSSATIFEKDILTYTWEWISGPQRVDPVQDLPTNPKATVTLNTLGTYRYRLLVDDNASPGLPSLASIELTVVAELPGNQPPIATITGPAGPVALGNEITLDASASIDPDGTPLNFRWRQVNALGEPIRSDELRGVFQGLVGVDTPIAKWQALQVGHFFFRLLVDDGELVSTTTISVSVIDTATAGFTVEATAGDVAAENVSPAVLADEVPALPACGGGLFPLVAVPFALVAIRRRR